MEVVVIVIAVVLVVAALAFIFRTHAAPQAHTSESRDRGTDGGTLPESGLFNPADAGAEEQAAPTARPDLLRGD